MASINVGVVLDRETEQRLRETADRLGQTKSGLIRNLIRAFVDNKMQLPPEYMHFAIDEGSETELFGNW